MSDRRLTISARVDEAIRRHGEETYPHECCGALVGRGDTVTDAGLDLLGFYHSHPDHPARPSQYDLDHAWPFFSYIIVSVRAGRPEAMTSWRLREDRSAFDPERLTYAEHN